MMALNENHLYQKKYILYTLSFPQPRTLPIHVDKPLTNHTNLFHFSTFHLTLISIQSLSALKYMDEGRAARINSFRKEMGQICGVSESRSQKPTKIIHGGRLRMK